MLDSVYAGDASNRCPYLVLIASALAPKPPNAASLMRSAGLAGVQGAAQELAQVSAYKEGYETVIIMSRACILFNLCYFLIGLCKSLNLD